MTPVTHARDENQDVARNSFSRIRCSAKRNFALHLIYMGEKIIMLTKYINAAMRKANYDKLEDGSFCGRIPECPGVIAFAASLYECQEELRSSLESWMIVKLRHGDQ